MRFLSLLDFIFITLPIFGAAIALDLLWIVTKSVYTVTIKWPTLVLRAAGCYIIGWPMHQVFNAWDNFWAFLAWERYVKIAPAVARPPYPKHRGWDYRLGLYVA